MLAVALSLVQLKDTHGAETIFKLKKSTKFEKILGVS